MGACARVRQAASRRRGQGSGCLFGVGSATWRHERADIAKHLGGGVARSDLEILLDGSFLGHCGHRPRQKSNGRFRWLPTLAVAERTTVPSLKPPLGIRTISSRRVPARNELVAQGIDLSRTALHRALRCSGGRTRRHLREIHAGVEVVHTLKQVVCVKVELRHALGCRGSGHLAGYGRRAETPWNLQRCTRLRPCRA